MGDRLPTTRYLSPGTVVIGSEGEWVEVRGVLQQPNYGRYLNDDEVRQVYVDLTRGERNIRRWNDNEDGA